EERKQVIVGSRVNTNELLHAYFKKLDKFPKAYLSSGAVGYYGDRNDEKLEEDDDPGEGFLAESCIEWEAAVDQIRQEGIRTITFRIGIVLSTQGGAMPKMLMPLNFFVGPYFGTGKQWYSWVHIDDICRMFICGIKSEDMSGTYNAVAPNPVRNREFISRLAKAGKRGALILPVPAFFLRLFLGEMADTVLWSARVSSEKIESTEFQFQFPELEEALQDLLRRDV
ncbi:MAG: TIGR01777 family oxidoreductase, partial [Saprospiraceae bacterium]|nr:TIGR01777 family oxidoreductase [Saprospiraceae bacterium]